MRDELNQENDPMLESALLDFRASVHAWSDAEYHRARPAVAAVTQRIGWQRAVAWILSLVLSFGILGAAAYQRHKVNVIARQHQQQIEQEQQRLLAEQQARETEELLANVDTDISREVPAAMEPLAELMAGEQ